MGIFKAEGIVMQEEKKYAHVLDLEQLLAVSNGYYLVLTYLEPPTKIEFNKIYLYLDSKDDFLTYAVKDIQGTVVTQKVNIDQNKLELPFETSQSIKKILQNPPSKLSYGDKKIFFKTVFLKSGFFQLNEAIAGYFDTNGFLISRDDSYFLTIGTEMPQHLVLNSYILLKKPEQPWEIYHINADGVQESAYEGKEKKDLENLLVQKNKPEDITTKEMNIIRELIVKIDYAEKFRHFVGDVITRWGWKINKKEEKEIPTVEKCPGLEKYVPYHHQSLASLFCVAINLTLCFDGRVGVLPPMMSFKNYATNIKIEENNSQVITKNSILALGFPFEDDWTLIPGCLETTFELASEYGKTGLKFKNFKSTNSVLVDLFTGNIHFENVSDEEKTQKEFDALRARAFREETPKSLYRWYKKMADAFFLDVSQNSFSAFVRNTKSSFIGYLIQFIQEFNQFLIHCNMEKFFWRDKTFSAYFKEVMQHVLKEDFLAAYRAVILSFLGDEKKGNPEAQEKDKFSEMEFRKYLSTFKTPTEKLMFVEEICNIICENKNQLYTVVDINQAFTKLQQRHISILKGIIAELELMQKAQNKYTFFSSFLNDYVYSFASKETDEKTLLMSGDESKILDEVEADSANKIKISIEAVEEKEKKEKLFEEDITLSKLLKKENILNILSDIFSALAYSLSGEKERMFFARLGHIIYVEKEQSEKSHILFLILEHVREQSASSGFINEYIGNFGFPFWKSANEVYKIEKTKEVVALFNAIENADIDALEKMPAQLSKSCKFGGGLK